MINFVHTISNFKVYLSSQVVRLRATEISYKMIFCRLLIFVPIFVGLLAGCFHFCNFRRVLNYICLIFNKVNILNSFLVLYTPKLTVRKENFLKLKKNAINLLSKSAWN